MPGPADDVRRLIDRGLARYGRGDLEGAIEEWQRALMLDSENHEAKTLMDFVQNKRPTGNESAVVAQRPATTMPVQPDDGGEAWQEATRGENQRTTAEREVLDDESLRPTRPLKSPTLESPIPGLLAQITDPGWVEVPSSDGVPEAPLVHEDTRKLGSQPHESDSGRVPATAEEPSYDEARGARNRASELVDRCRADFERGEVESAVDAAEGALLEGERAPPPGIAEVIEPARPLFEQIFEAYVGPPAGIPVVALSADALAAQSLDHRAGFLLSRIDGATTVDEIVDVAGMPRFEAMRTLAGLIRMGAIRLL